jgi:hypothetical protein
LNAHNASMGTARSSDIANCSNGCCTYRRCSRGITPIDGEVPTDKTIAAAASAGGSNANDTSMTDTSTTAAANFHCPISAATGGYRRCDSLTAAEHHVRAVPRRLHPHLPRTGLGRAPHRHILGCGTGRPTMLHETSVIETVAASHVIGVLLSECVKWSNRPSTFQPKPT